MRQPAQTATRRCAKLCTGTYTGLGRHERHVSCTAGLRAVIPTDVLPEAISGATLAAPHWQDIRLQAGPDTEPAISLP